MAVPIAAEREVEFESVVVLERLIEPDAGSVIFDVEQYLQRQDPIRPLLIENFRSGY